MVGTSPSAPRPARVPFAAGGVPPAPRRAAPRRAAPRHATPAASSAPLAIRSRLRIGAPLKLRHARHQPSAASDPSTPPAMVRARAGLDPPLSASGHAAPRHVSSQQCAADDPRTLSPSVPRPGRAPFAASAAPPAPFRPRRARPIASSATPAARPRRLRTGAAVEDRPAVDACPKAGSDTRRPNLRRWCVIRSPTTAIRGSDYPRWRRRCSPNIPR